MAAILPAPVSAAERIDPLANVLGPSSARVIGAGRIAAIFGTVTSGFRSAAHNRRVGGVPNSFHLLGLALDVQRRPGVSHQTIDIALRRAGLVLVESVDEGDHSHFAFANQLSVVPPVASITSTPAIVPSKPPAPRVLADEHGVLLAFTPSLELAGQPPLK